MYWGIAILNYDPATNVHSDFHFELWPSHKCTEWFSFWTLTQRQTSLKCEHDFSEKKLEQRDQVVRWLVQRFRVRGCRFDPDDQRLFTPSAHARRQTLPVWSPTLNKIPSPFTFLRRTFQKNENEKRCLPDFYHVGAQRYVCGPTLPYRPTRARDLLVHVCKGCWAGANLREIWQSVKAWHHEKCSAFIDRGDSPSRWKHLETALRFRTDNRLCAGAWTVFVALPQAEIDNFEVRTFAVVAFVPFGVMFEVVFFSSFLRYRQNWVEQILERNSICPRKAALRDGGDATQSSDSSKIRFLHAADTVQACTHRWLLNADANTNIKL